MSNQVNPDGAAGSDLRMKYYDLEKKCQALLHDSHTMRDHIAYLNNRIATIEYHQIRRRLGISKLFGKLLELVSSKRRKQRKLIDMIKVSGLFDSQHYLSQVGTHVRPEDAIWHYFEYGTAQGLNPSQLFSTRYYLSCNSDVELAKMNPLAHYVKFGKNEGRHPSQIAADMDLVRNVFDAEFYLEKNPDVARANIDPLFHYCIVGWKEGRDPSSSFSTKAYIAKMQGGGRPVGNPLVHKCRVNNTYQKSHSKDPDLLIDVYEDSVISAFANKDDIKPIAFYLPQFHEVEENNEWWGKRFTDWTSCKRAKKVYGDQWQQRKPHPDIGYYDLTDIGTLKKQAAIAKRHGIHGFCFYYYNFSGKRLLEKPLNLLCENKDIDINYCVCWANENWSRRWDGSDDEILMKQKYLPRDNENTIADIAKLFSDPRYIRFESKPVVLVYRKSHLKDPVETTETWRKWCRENGIGDIYLICVQTYQDYTDPRKYGFDAASEMPAHLHHPSINRNFSPAGLEHGFSGRIHSYADYANGIIDIRKREKVDYTLFRTVALKFDNTGRKPHGPHIFTHFSVDIFHRWLLDSMWYACKELPRGSRFIFINAWNEWAEGTYLEPDVHFGYTALNTVSRALNGTRPPTFRKPRRGPTCPSRILFTDSEFDKTDTMAVPAGSCSVAVHIHIYHDDLIPQFVAALKHFERPFHLFVTTPFEAVEEKVRKAFGSIPLVQELEVVLCENRGRDIGPLLVEIGPRLSDFDIMLHIHSKKSDPVWFQYLKDRTFGSSKIVNRIINQLYNEESVGVVYPQTYPRWSYHEDFGGNGDKIREVCKFLKIKTPPEENIHFPAGSFYWAKPKALKKLFNYKWNYEHFPEEPIGNDGTLAHGVERLISHIAHEEGYSSVVTASLLDSTSLPAHGGGKVNALENETWYNGFIQTFTKLIHSGEIKNVVFDIFDTLVARPFEKPEDLFIYMKPLIRDIVGNEGMDGFPQIRIWAEDVCRRALKPNKDVTIHDIYKKVGERLGLSAEESNQLKKIEINLEIALVEPREAGLAMLRAARESGMKVILASDMYLTTPAVNQMLEAAGVCRIGYDALFVSSDVGVRKDSGKMFKFLAREQGIKLEETVVVGDNLHSDVNMPRFCGCRSMHVPKVIDMLKRAYVLQRNGTVSLRNNKISHMGILANSMFGAEDRRCSSLLDSNPYNLGYLYLGPLLYEFSRQLILDARKNGIKKLHFLTREGVIMKKAYDIVARGMKDAPESALLYSSRTIANTLSVSSVSSLKNIVDRNPYMKGGLVPFFQGRFGYRLTDEDWTLLRANNIEDIQYVMSRDKKKILRAVTLLGDKLYETMSKKRGGFTEYLQSEIVEGSALVDIGYSGTMQNCIQEVFNRPIKGYYIMSFPDKNTHLDKVSFLHENLDDAVKLGELFFKHSFCYEAVMMPPVPSVVGVTRNDDGDIVPVYDDIVIPVNEIIAREAVISGVEGFASAVVNRFELLPEFDFETALWGFKEFFENPTLCGDVAALKDICIDDKYTGSFNVELVNADPNECFISKASALVCSPGKKRQARKTVYVHIGSPKTGTSALQHFWAINRESLKNDGIIFPKTKIIETHHALSFAFYKESGQSEPYFPADLKSAKEEFEELGITDPNYSYIISTEGLFNPVAGAVQKLRDWIPSCFDVKIIAYLRRQDCLIESTYIQHIKNIHSNPEIAFDGSLCYSLILKDWIDVFGMENVLVRPYEVDQFSSGSIYADFHHHVFGKAIGPEYTVPKHSVNPSLRGEFIHFQKFINTLEIERKIKASVALLLTQYATLPSFDSYDKLYKFKGVISSEQRLHIIQKYAKDNTLIARSLLKRAGGNLFQANGVPGQQSKSIAEFDDEQLRPALIYIKEKIPYGWTLLCKEIRERDTSSIINKRIKDIVETV